MLICCLIIDHLSLSKRRGEVVGFGERAEGGGGGGGGRGVLICCLP